MTDRPAHDDPAYDDVAAVNRDRWNRLVEAGVEYARPWLDLTPDLARSRLDPHGILVRYAGDLTDKQVLCLAAGGGQQSAAFALLGAQVTVTDLADRQLEQDRVAAAHYNLHVRTQQGDMRDLAWLPAASMDIVYQAFSITFVPSVAPVFDQVARVLRPGGLYRLEWYNPFVQLIDPEKDWTGAGYLLKHPYRDGIDTSEWFPTWTVYDDDGTPREVAGPREFVHTLSTVLNGLIARGFVLLHCSEFTGAAPDPAPGSWEHFQQVAPPYLTLWAKLHPAALTGEPRPLG